jgi:hypothetical protein
MPNKWVRPDIFLSYKRVKIYHVYHDGCIGDRASYWFTTIPKNDDLDGCEQEGQFDIREIYSTVKVRKTPKLKDLNLENFANCTEKNFKSIMRAGIDTGLIK